MEPGRNMAAKRSSAAKRTKKAVTPSPCITSSTIAAPCAHEGTSPGVATSGLLLSTQQQQQYLELLARGASPTQICRDMEITPAAVRATAEQSPECREALADVELGLSQNVQTAVYILAMKGNVTAQSLWLKHRPPP